MKTCRFERMGDENKPSPPARHNFLVPSSKRNIFQAIIFFLFNDIDFFQFQSMFF